MTQAQGRVAILPHEIKLGWNPGRIPLDRLIWPLGRPEALRGKTLRDLTPDDHLIVFPRKTLHIRFGFGTLAKVSLLMLEPAAIHAFHHRLLRLTHRRFHRILSSNEDLLAAVPNGEFLPFGSTWVPDWQTLEIEKSRYCSLIASSKRSQEGHDLRHRIADWIQAEQLEIDLIGGGYAPFDAKSDGLAPYGYSVVIENVRERNYFTEKLIDAILCETVPIYWGCPNISDFFDTEGMMICQSERDIKRAIASMSEEDYLARLPALRGVKDTAAHYGDHLTRAARVLLGQMP